MKRRRWTGSNILCGFMSALALIFVACNAREPGCLDIEAKNFDVSAEKHDPSECIYPNLILNVIYQWADSSLMPAFLYTDATGRPYAIHGVQVLLSGFVIRSAMDQDLVIEKTVTLTIGNCDEGEIRDVPDDFLFADRSSFNYAIGAFRTSGTMQQARVYAGVNSAYTPLCIESLPASHKLASERAGYDTRSEEFALGRFIISRDSVNADRDTIFAYGPAQELDFDLSRDFHRGKEDTLYSAIDFSLLFSGIDVSEADTVIGNTIGSRIPAAITIH